MASVLIKNAETKELNPCCALMEYFPTDNTVDPVERLSEELKKDPFWVKRAQTEKMYTDFYVGDADPSDPLVFTCICQRSGIGCISGLSDHISRGRQPQR